MHFTIEFAQSYIRHTRATSRINKSYEYRLLIRAWSLHKHDYHHSLYVGFQFLGILLCRWSLLETPISQTPFCPLRPVYAVTELLKMPVQATNHRLWRMASARSHLPTHTMTGNRSRCLVTQTCTVWTTCPESLRDGARQPTTDLWCADTNRLN